MTLSRSGILAELEVQEQIEGLTPNIKLVRKIVESNVVNRASELQSLLDIKHHRYGKLSYQTHRFYYIRKSVLKLHELMGNFFKENPMTCCKFCNDGTGKTIYPYYGMAPHDYEYNNNGVMLGAISILPMDKMPSNFIPDGEWHPYMLQGTYTHCMECGAGQRSRYSLSIVYNPTK